MLAVSKKANTGKDESSEVTHKKSKAVPCKAKAKKPTKPKPSADNRRSSSSSSSSSSSDDSDSDRETTRDRKPALKKLKKSIGQKAIAVKSNDVKEVIVRKRMASLNASAMMAASYEVERQFDKCEEKMYKMSSDAEEHISSPPKKAKEIKNEVLEAKEVCTHAFIRFADLFPLVQLTSMIFIN